MGGGSWIPDRSWQCLAFAPGWGVELEGQGVRVWLAYYEMLWDLGGCRSITYGGRGMGMGKEGLWGGLR